jgi:hypothetical protein
MASSSLSRLVPLVRKLDVEHVTAHAFHDHLMLQQVGAHPVRIGVGLVHLVDGDDHRHAGLAGMIDRLSSGA